MFDYTLYIQKSIKFTKFYDFVPLQRVVLLAVYINQVLKFQGLEKLNRELKEEEEEQLPVDISLFPDSIFKGFQASLILFFR
jgi:hypothetical protein